MSFENFLQKNIFPELEAGRPGWDRPHTEAVVKYVKEIIENSPNLDLDREVLVIAGYAHDWGYSGLFKDGQKLDFDDVKDAKSAHMKIGAEKLENLLSNRVFDFLSEDRKSRAVHLVKKHDKLDQLKKTDELVLMEADTLGALDVRAVEPTFDRESNRRYMRSAREDRFSKFITDYGKKKFEELFKLRKEYYASKTS